MSRFQVLGLWFGFAVLTGGARADSLWDRADPNTALIFQSYRAHRVGDLLTITVDETTGFEGQEQRQMNKETQSGGGINMKMDYAAGAVTPSFTGEYNGATNSQRKFNAQNNTTIDRKFTDKMTVSVVAVLPNGNLVVEGFRQRIVQREIRTLHVTGIVRPGDIGPSNTVPSYFVANFIVRYDGRGPESSYFNHGWWGRVVNVIWPF